MATSRARKSVSKVEAATPEVAATPEINHAHLKLIVDAGDNGLFTPASVHESLAAAGLVELNPEAVNAEGEVATRATDAGFEFIYPADGVHAASAIPSHETQKETPAMTENQAPAVDMTATPAVTPAAAAAPAAAPVAKAKPAFVIEDNVPMPESARRAGGRTEFYPFEALQVGQSFKIDGKAAKEMSSVIYGARARYSRVVEGQTRTMRTGKVVPVTEVVRDFECKDVEGGCRVWRIQ